MAIWSPASTASRWPIRRTLPRIVADTPIGKTVNIDVLRKGRKQTLQHHRAKLAEDASRQAGQGAAACRAAETEVASVSQLGLSLGALDGAARAKFKIGGNVQGVVVTAVDPGSPAADKNLRPGDVIVEVQSQAVKTPDDVDHARRCRCQGGQEGRADADQPRRRSDLCRAEAGLAH